MKELKKNNYIEKRLSNGLKVYFFKDKKLKRNFVSYSIKFGSNGFYRKFIYDNKKYTVKPGLAHFLEHTLIEHSKYGNMMHNFSDNNYESNGITYDELTTYFFFGIPKKFNKYLEMLINMVDNPVFTKDDIEEVKPAVIEELRKDDDNKYRKAYTINEKNSFNWYDYSDESNNVLGSEKDTKNFTYEDVKLVYDAYYNIDNKFMLIAGNIDINKTIEVLEKIFKKVPAHPNKLQKYPYKRELKVRKELETIKLPYENKFEIITYKFKKPKNISHDEFNDYLNIYLAMKFDKNNEKIKKLMEREVILSQLGFSVNIFEDNFSVKFDADVKDIDKIYKFLNKELNTKDLKEEEFELLKKIFIVNELTKRDNIYLYFRNFPYYEEYTKDFDNIDRIKKMNFKRLIKLMDSIDFTNVTRTVIDPNKKN